MKQKISPYDYQLLSEYVDGQLPNGKKVGLEARLKSEEGLRAALEDLRQTRALLRSLPHIKAPRNFTLTPQMVGRKTARERPAHRWVPVFQFSAVLSSVLLMLVLAGDFLGLGLIPAAMPAAKSAPQGIVAMQDTAQNPSEKSLQAQNEKAEGATPGEGEAMRSISPKFSSPVTSTITNTAPISETVPVSPMLSAPLPTGNPTAEAIADASTGNAPVNTPGKNLWRLAEVTLAGLALSSILAVFLIRRQIPA